MEDELRQLEPDVQSVWRIKLSITFGIVTLVAAAYDVLNLFDDDRALPLGAATIVALVVAAAIVVWLPRLRYRFWRFGLSDEELYLERGILNRVRTIVPLRRIQHIDVSQDIIEREYDLGRLIVHTAGTRSSDVILPGLQMEEAEQLRDNIRRYVLDDAV